MCLVRLKWNSNPGYASFLFGGESGTDSRLPWRSPCGRPAAVPIRSGRIGRTQTLIYRGFESRVRLVSIWRRERDSNPRYAFGRIHTFQACAFNRSAISPFVLESMSTLLQSWSLSDPPYPYRAADYKLIHVYALRRFGNCDLFLPKPGLRQARVQGVSAH